MKQTIAVAGMTCANCMRHVSAALSDIEGVRAVQVTLQPPQAEIQSDRTIEREELVAALDEAGYTLA